ncbi:MAG: hypothetical protein IJR37_00545, partial [Schwartzia sp.]|nr:hypothetical protein [Schwartzia sp. (in: firmicutes)]
RFYSIEAYYFKIRTINFSGEWGDTLCDFFRPEDEDANYSEEYSLFAPLAAALSKGQRASLNFISLSALLRLALDSDSVMAKDCPKVGDVFTDENGAELDRISIYSGINRAIFRRGVALTSATRMQKSMGNDPYEDLWDEGGIIDILAYSTFAVGTAAMLTGSVLYYLSSARYVSKVVSDFKNATGFVDVGAQHIVNPGYRALLTKSNKILAEQAAKKLGFSQLGTMSRWMMGIGGALMLLSIALKAVQLYQFYHRTFTQIPTMIVDEADIVTYTTNSEGKKVKNITFDQFVYYEVVNCNRQQIGIHTNAQSGVSDYAEWGCGDAADINADVGKQWLAIYINRSPKKGNPILADSLLLRTGAEEVKKGKQASEAAKMPSGYNGCLHMFASESPVKIDNEKYCYRSDNQGMYLYWKGDTGAFTASSFGTGGTIAVSAVGGLIVGIAGATAVLLPKKKKEQGHEPVQD